MGWERAVQFNLSKHARQEMQRRGISEAIVRSVLDAPQQVLPRSGDK
jgi:hypothetical protein